MGWISKDYNNETHSSFNKEAAASFIVNEFNGNGYSVEKFSFRKAKEEYSRHEIYLRMIHPTGKLFVMVVIVEIDKGEIYWKEIEESMGPRYTNCPKYIYEGIEAPNDYAVKWRNNCNKRF